MALAPASAILGGAAGNGGAGSGGGHLASNLLTFARLLRRAGLPVGAGDVLAAAEALTIVDLADRAQVKDALRAVMVHRREHFELFDQAFTLFWRDPDAGRHAAALELFEAGKEKE
ncbi:MAG: hypothetical protein IRZ13_20795, partial [Acetobacteraceae bacterium]|nr:hypothetical protein [Acetobacteraceae bacterium]